ncbi:MAG: chromate efflux transporter [Paracoccaceae bacterium]
MSTGTAPSSSDRLATRPGLAEATALYAKIGLLSFGGPAGQIALMQSEIVERRGWVEAEAFDRGLSFSMMLPGPEAQQLATWLGWRIHGTLGGLAAGGLFILPGAALMLALAWLAAAQGQVGLVGAVFAGVQPVVIAVVLQAMGKLAGRALGNRAGYALAAAAFVALAGLGLPFPLIVAAAALAGLALDLGVGPGQPAPPLGGAARAALWRRAGLTVGVSAELVVAVYALVRALAGPDPFDGLASLFLTAAFVSFGGAYALLPFVADRAVEAYGWLTAAEMLNGLAIAEATPGPLILVTTYAGFFAGWNDPGDGLAGLATGALATFYTFAPSFMLILAFAPVVERVQSVPWARRALAGVSAAVVGVIANLAVYLAEAAFFPAGLAEPVWAKIALFALALGLVFGLKLSIMRLVGLGALAGGGLHLAGAL